MLSLVAGSGHAEKRSRGDTLERCFSRNPALAMPLAISSPGESMRPLKLISLEELQKRALHAISQLWPAIGLRELRSGGTDQQLVFARWVLAHLLYEEAGLSRRLVADLVNWRASASVAYAASALMNEVETNRRRAHQVAEAESLFRRLLEGRDLPLEAFCPAGVPSCHPLCKCAAARRQAMLRGHSAKTEQPACGEIAGRLQRAGNPARAVRIPTD